MSRASSRSSKILAFALLAAVGLASSGRATSLTSTEAAPGAAPRAVGSTVDWRQDVARDADFEALLATARADGSVRAIVGLQMSWSTDAHLTPAERGRQADEIVAAREALLGTMGRSAFTVVRTYDRLPFVAVDVSVEALEELRRGGRAAQLKEDAVLTLDLLNATKTTEAAETTALGFTGAGQRIAILDSGVDADHPFLDGRVDTASSACFSKNDCTDGTMVGPGFAYGPGAAEPCTYTPNTSICEHGTHVAGIAAGADGIGGLSGVAPDAVIVPIKVTSKGGIDPLCIDTENGTADSSCPTIWQTDVIAGLEFAHKADVDVVNMSLSDGGFFPGICWDPFYLVAVTQLVDGGTPVVAAAGNSGQTMPVGKSGIAAPACILGVISVGNTNNDDVVHASSQSSPNLSLLAPGTDVLSSRNGTFGIWSGTSLAAPHVAGALAVLRAHAPSKTPAELLAAMQQTGKPVTDPANGITTPRLRLLAALVSFGDTGFNNAYAKILKGGRILSEGASARNMPGSPETIDISALPFKPGDTIDAAYVFFMTTGAPDDDAIVQVVGSADVPATLIGASRAPCGVAGGGAMRVYQADVTPYAWAGKLTIDGIAPAAEGFSLVIVTRNEAAPARHVVIRAGAMATTLDDKTMTHAFLPVFEPLVDVELHVGMGHSEPKKTEQSMRLGGHIAFHANAFSGTDGGNWDDLTMRWRAPTVEVREAPARQQDHDDQRLPRLGLRRSGVPGPVKTQLDARPQRDGAAVAHGA